MVKLPTHVRVSFVRARESIVRGDLDLVSQATL